MPVALTLSYPLLVHLAVWLELPVIKIVALLVLALGILLPGLLKRSPLTWGIFSLIMLMLGTIYYLDDAIYLLYLPPIIIPMLLGSVFLRTLLPGETPLVTIIAERARGPLPEEMRRYTWRVTLMWGSFFVAMLLWSALLPWLTTVMLWSLFTNFLNYLMAALLFVGEYIYRRWRFQDYDHPGFIDYIKIVVRADIRKR